MDWSFDAWPSGEPYNWGQAGRGGKVYDAMEYHVDLGCGTLKKGKIGIDRFPAPGVNIVMDLDRGLVAAAAPEPGRDAAERLGNGWRYRTPYGRRDHQQPDYLDYPDIPVIGERKLSSTEAYQIGQGLPFDDHSIESIISHHALEHIGDGFIALIDEVYRVLKPGGIFRPITPLFPSYAAVSDPDHRRYFMEGTWDVFCGHLGDENNPTGSWLDNFSVPYTKARFEKLDEDITPPTPREQHWSREDVREIRVALRAIK